MVLENDGGRWVGTSTRVYGQGLRALTGDRVVTETVILRGEGAYEGLSAYLLDVVQPEYVGAIFADGKPPVPEPVAE